MTDEVVIPPVDLLMLQIQLQQLNDQVFALQAMVAALMTELTQSGSLAPTQMYDALSHWSNRLEERQQSHASRELAAVLGETSELLYEMLLQRGVLSKGMDRGSASPADLPDYVLKLFEETVRLHEEPAESGK